MTTKLSDQELLEIISSGQDTPSYANNLSLFISTFGLEEGTLKIPVKLIYRLYKLWSTDKMTEDAFYKEMSLLMPNKAILPDGTHAYLLNKTTLKINESVYNLIKDKKINKERSHYYKKHFESFLKYANVTKGSVWIPASSLRSLYLSWVKDKYKKNPIGAAKFNGFCKLYFDCRNTPLEIAVNKKVGDAQKEEDQTGPNARKS